jgi:predicted short-subunit dehydrogenase-like oxidoreductase (DUF2520 family)
MLPDVNGKPRIAIVGKGNLGGALAQSLLHAGYAVKTISRGRRSTPPVAQDSAAKIQADVVWFCVPDGEIARAAGVLAKKTEWRRKIALHSSGALNSGELEILRQQGAAVASVHPLMTFVRGARPPLKGVSFAIEGDVAAVRAARRIVKDLGGIPYSIRKEEKAAYHAWATFASPLLTALLATTEQVAALAGIEAKAARSRALPILRQTLANYAAFGAAGGFSGPIVRGDVDTIERHMRVLRGAPGVREVYSALGNSALRYLPAKNMKLIKRILESE